MSIGQPISTIDTPSMLVNLPQMEENITHLFQSLSAISRSRSGNTSTPITVRPHLKTSKSVAVANRLVRAGATGGCVAKLSEAAVFCAAGFTDLLITSPIAGEIKAGRFAELVRLHGSGATGLKIVVDSLVGAEGIYSALSPLFPPPPPLSPEEANGVDQRRRNEKVSILLDINVGQNRTGVPPTSSSSSAAALELAISIRQSFSSRMEIIGIQGYEGHLQHIHDASQKREACLSAMRALVQTASDLRRAGFNIATVTTGGTGTAGICASVEGITEVQPGSFVFMDVDYRNALGSGNRYKNSLTIVSTVLSKQGERKVTIDAGLKALTTDSGLAECKDGRYVYDVMGDEHGSLTWGEGTTPRLEVGDRVELIPSHIDPTVNLHDAYYAHRDGVIEEIWRVDARGKIQ